MTETDAEVQYLCSPEAEQLPDGVRLTRLIVAARKLAARRVHHAPALVEALRAAYDFIADEYRDEQSAALDGSPFAKEARPVLATIGAALSQSAASPVARDPAYDRGRRDMLNALLALNPHVAQRWHMISGGTEQTFTNHEGRLPFDVVYWVTEVAEQLGIEPVDDTPPAEAKS